MVEERGSSKASSTPLNSMVALTVKSCQSIWAYSTRSSVLGDHIHPLSRVFLVQCISNWKSNGSCCWCPVPVIWTYIWLVSDIIPWLLPDRRCNFCPLSPQIIHNHLFPLKRKDPTQDSRVGKGNSIHNVSSMLEFTLIDKGLSELCQQKFLAAKSLMLWLWSPQDILESMQLV